MMKDTTKVYILKPIWLFDLVWMTLTCMQGHIVLESENFCAYVLTNLSFDLDEFSWAVVPSWFVEAHAKFILHD